MRVKRHIKRPEGNGLSSERTVELDLFDPVASLLEHMGIESVALTWADDTVVTITKDEPTLSGDTHPYIPPAPAPAPEPTPEPRPPLPHTEKTPRF